MPLFYTNKTATDGRLEHLNADCNHLTPEANHSQLKCECCREHSDAQLRHEVEQIKLDPAENVTASFAAASARYEVGSLAIPQISKRNNDPAILRLLLRVFCVWTQQ